MRSLLAGLLLLLGALLVPVSTTASWLRSAVVPTEGYVETVTPLATDPAIVSEIEDQFSAAMIRALNSSGVLARTPRLRAAVKVITDKVANAVVQSPSFETAWIAANRSAHEQLIAVLEGDPRVVRATSNNGVDIRIGTLTDDLRRQLEAAGVPFASQLPEVQASFPVSDRKHLEQAQQAYALLDRWGALLPFITAALIILGLLVARRRARALGWTAVISLVGLGITFLGLVVAKQFYLDSVPVTIMQDAASAFFDTITSGLRHDLTWVALASAVALAVAGVVGLVSARRTTAS